MDFRTLRANLARVREEIVRIQASNGLDHPVTIVAVTKGHPVEAIEAARAAGLTEIGENRVQEALAKREDIRIKGLHWHLIGHLQTNKAKYVPTTFAWVHSVDSSKVAQALSRAMTKSRVEAGTPRGESLPVLLQVNVAGEAQKSGCAPEEASELSEQIRDMEGLELRGLMTMAPYTEDQSVQHRVFSRLRELRDGLTRSGSELPHLSMGMSGDYRAAVAEGSTMLRLGTVLFGERPR